MFRGEVKQVGDRRHRETTAPHGPPPDAGAERRARDGAVLLGEPRHVEQRNALALEVRRHPDERPARRSIDTWAGRGFRTRCTRRPARSA